MATKYLSKYIRQVFECNSEVSDFFGYYNYDTLDNTQTRLLCHRIPFDDKHIGKNDVAEVGFYSLLDGKWIKIDETDSFNWDQGSMLQWLPGEGNDNKVIFNRSENNRIKSRVRDVKTGDVKDIDWPIYCITPDGKKSISLEMERSYWCRAYHYYSVANSERDGLVDEQDGIFEIDLERNVRKRIISIQDIIATDADPDFEAQKHWLEHIMISPSGKRFVFLHRFAYPDNIYRYQTRMFISDVDGGNMQIIPGWRINRWSHFGWNGDDAFAIYSYKTASITKSLQSVYEGFPMKGTTNQSLKDVIHRLARKTSRIVPKTVKDIIKGQNSFYQYYTINREGVFTLSQTFDKKVFAIDGHESFTEDNRYMITDTYTDSKGFRSLIVYDLINKKSIVVLKLREGRTDDSKTAIDLHPKLCKNNNYIAVDSNHSGTPHVILFELDWDTIKKKLGR